MKFIGHGIDIIDLDRVRKRLANPAGDWLLAAFTEQERATEDSVHRVTYYAGRFAAKEAVGKALGTGISGDLAWTDVEILRSEEGAPTIRLAAEALAIARSLGITCWSLSISHSGGYAVASAIAFAG